MPGYLFTKNAAGAIAATLALTTSACAAQGTESLFPAGEPDTLELESAVLTLETGDAVNMESGWFYVPETRENETGNVYALPVRVFRTEAEVPADPIFLIAGGPGSSRVNGLEDEDQYGEIAFYRQFADVIVYDQRGGGESRPELTCDRSGQLPMDEPLSLEARGRMLAELGALCRDRWLEAGVDLSALNAHESAADLNALAEALGYDQITLIGGSYATHLILHTAHRHPERVARILLAGVEGPDHTWDNPDGILAALERIAADIEAAPEMAGRLPQGGLLAGLARAQADLADEPVSVTLSRNGEEQTIVLGLAETQVAAQFQAGRRNRPQLWPQILMSIANGQWDFLAQGAMGMRRVQLDNPMHYMMDCSSGISDARRAQYATAPAILMLGNINAEYEYGCAPWPVADLGSGFLDPVTFSGPALIVQGDWDISTPIENALETMEHLPNADMIIVRRGGHGAYYQLWREWEGFRPLLADFVRGRAVSPPAEYELPPLFSEGEADR